MLLAYIDPAIGSMILQAVAAVVLAGGLFFRRIFYVPLVWLGLKQADSHDSESGDSHNGND